MNSEMDFTIKELRAVAKALEEYDEELDESYTISRGDYGHQGAGIYIWCTEYPEEGSIFVDV